MIGMVLAAGRGERMRPLTHRLAKPALPVLNQPLLSYSLRLLAEADVRRTAVNVHHLPETVEAILPGCTPEGMQVEVFREETLLGTAGGIKNAESVLGGGTFLLSNGDFVLDLDPKELLEAHRRSGAAATMVLLPYQDRAGYAPVEVADGRVVRIAGRPEAGGPGGTRHMFAGLHVIEPEVLSRIPAGKPYEINQEVYPSLIAAREKIGAHVVKGAWLEIGTPGQYLRRTMHLLAPPFRSLLARHGIGVEEEKGATVVGLAGAKVSPTATLHEGIVLGDGVSLGRDVTLRRTVVWRGAALGYGSDIADSIIGEGVMLPPDSRFHHRIVLARGDDLPPDPSARREGDLVYFPL